MAEEITELENPIDAMHLIHNALRTAAERVENMAGMLAMFGNLQHFRSAFNLWSAALVYHAEMEDEHMTAQFVDWVAARENEDKHRTLEQKLEDVLTCLNEEIGKAPMIARTQRHLYGCTVALRIAQDDHLEEEEEFILPVLRQQMDEEHQKEVIRRLLIDEEAEDQRWILDWISQNLTSRERGLLTDLESRLAESSQRSSEFI